MPSRQKRSLLEAEAGGVIIVHNPNKRRAPISLEALDWEAQKANIKKLFLTENNTLKVVRSRMLAEYGFDASQSQYDTQVKSWGWRKQLKPDEWKYVDMKIKQRKRDGKDSSVYQNCVLVPKSQLDKKITYHLMDGTPNQYTPQEIAGDCPAGIYISSSEAPSQSIDVPLLDIDLEPPDPTAPSYGLSIDNTQNNFDNNYTLEPNIFDYASVGHRIVTSMHSGNGLSNELSSREKGIQLVDDLRRLSSSLPDNFSEKFGMTEDKSVVKLQLSVKVDHLLKLLVYGVSNKLICVSRIPGNAFEHQILASLNSSMVDALVSSKSPSVGACLEYIIELSLRRGDFKLGRWLIDKKDLSDKIRRSPWFFCLLRHGFRDANIEYIRFLLEGYDYDNQILPLDAVQDPEVVRFLVHECKVDPNKIYNKMETTRRSSCAYEYGLPGHTALLMAINGGHIDAVDAWKKEGANINASACYGPDGAIRLCIREDPPSHEDCWNGEAIPLQKAIGKFYDVRDRFIISEDEELKEISREGKMGQYLDIIRYLLREGANVHARTVHSYTAEDGDTLLHMAVSTRLISLVGFLLKKGADPNALAERGTPLLQAVSLQSIEIVQLLVDAGAEVNFIVPARNASNTTSGNKTALLVAVEDGHFKLVELLHKAGARVDAPVTDSLGRSITELALATGQESGIAQLLVRSDAPERFILSQASKLARIQHAVSTRNAAGVQEMLKTVIDVREPQKVWSHIIHNVIYTGQQETLRILLDAGVDINGCYCEEHRIMGSHRFSPFGCAIAASLEEPQWINPQPGLEQIDRQAIISILLDAGVSLDASCVRGSGSETGPHYDGLPPLHFALYYGWTNIVATENIVCLLLRERADVNNIGYHVILRGFREHPRVTPLLLASDLHVTTWSLNITCLLLENGADVNPMLEITPLQAAALGFRGELGMVELLLRNKASINAPAYQLGGCTALQASIHYAVESGDLQLVDLLWREKADINAPAARINGRTALQEAAEAPLSKDTFKVAEHLLNLGSDVNAPPAEEGGLTALQAAASRGNLKLVLLFLQREADVNAAGSIKRGRTALEGAAKFGRLDIVQLLINAGADTNLPGSHRYRQAEAYARKYGHHIVADLLRSKFEGVGWVAESKRSEGSEFEYSKYFEELESEYFEERGLE